MVETETDVLGVLGYYPARQPDNPHLRLWEMAGTAHADKAQVGAASRYFGCTLPVNRGQQTFVLRAAIRDLNLWVANGTAPPHRGPLVGRDKAGNRSTSSTRWATSRAACGPRRSTRRWTCSRACRRRTRTSSACCRGRPRPSRTATLAARYPSRAAYLADYAKATDAAIKAGFVLPRRPGRTAGPGPARPHPRLTSPPGPEIWALLHVRRGFLPGSHLGEGLTSGVTP